MLSTEGHSCTVCQLQGQLYLNTINSKIQQLNEHITIKENILFSEAISKHVSCSPVRTSTSPGRLEGFFFSMLSSTLKYSTASLSLVNQ